MKWEISSCFLTTCGDKRGHNVLQMPFIATYFLVPILSDICNYPSMAQQRQNREKGKLLQPWWIKGISKSISSEITFSMILKTELCFIPTPSRLSIWLNLLSCSLKNKSVIQHSFSLSPKNFLKLYYFKVSMTDLTI